MIPARAVEPEERALDPGTMVGGYRIERLIGAGGMGWVYGARSVLDDRVAALKLLRRDQLRIEGGLDRMLREASILASVAHPGVPRFYACGLLADRQPWIAMELVAGQSLAARMLPADDVIALGADIAAVLAAAHARGITHRDLKPDNILLVPADREFPLRVIDWGIAHHVAGARYTQHDEAIGTPTYMSPEQARGGSTDGFCDIYGLGVVAYQALAGRPPFVGKSSVEILVQHLNRPAPPLAPRCPDAPLALVALVERMLAKRAEDRPSAREVHAELTALRAAPGTSAYRSCALADASPLLREPTAITRRERA
jgi:serine/threonine-protein kinase